MDKFPVAPVGCVLRSVVTELVGDIDDGALEEEFVVAVPIDRELPKVLSLYHFRSGNLAGYDWHLIDGLQVWDADDLCWKTFMEADNDMPPTGYFTRITDRRS